MTFFLVCRRLRPQICSPSGFLTAVLFSAHCPCCIFLLRIPSYVFCNKIRQIHTSCDTFPSNLAVRKESHRIYPLDTCSAELSTGLDRKDFAESSYCSMQIFYSTVAAVTSFAWFKRSVFNIPNIGTQVFQH